jgi:hypothetical protein
VEQRFAAKETELANVAFVQNGQRTIEVIDINPSQVPGRHSATREVAEVAACIAGIGDGNIAWCRTATADYAKHVPGLRCRYPHAPLLAPKTEFHVSHVAQSSFLQIQISIFSGTSAATISVSTLFYDLLEFLSNQHPSSRHGD